METDEKNKATHETSGDQEPGGHAGLDRHEGQTNNGTIGGTGSDLDKTTERLGGSPHQKEKDDTAAAKNDGE